MSVGRGGNCAWCGGSYGEGNMNASFGCGCGKYYVVHGQLIRPKRLRECGGCIALDLYNPPERAEHCCKRCNEVYLREEERRLKSIEKRRD